MKKITIFCLITITCNLNSNILFAQKNDPILEAIQAAKRVDEKIFLNGTPKEKYNLAMQKASINEREKKYSIAMKLYNLAIEQNVNLCRPFYNRGSLKEIQGDYRGAIDDYLTAEAQIHKPQYQSNRLEVLYSMARCYEKIDFFKEAITCHMKILKIRELSLDYNSIGMIYYKMKEYKNALQYFDDAIRLDSDDHRFFYNKGIVLIKIGETVNGCKALSRSGELGSSVAYEAIREHCQ
ncbi:tetratricopeptide repeat protein [Persicitalea sp.]|uniref:tetratricopeptide repeat protein n=1 Tax=Persicitalea sp. TaxID=3100273 RepID=UPI003593AB75